MMKMDAYQKLLKYPSNWKVDLIIDDYSIGPCFLGFSHKFNYPPMVSVTAFNNPTFTSEVFGGHQYYAYVPHMFYIKDTKLNFFERIYNLILYTVENL